MTNCLGPDKGRNGRSLDSRELPYTELRAILGYYWEVGWPLSPFCWYGLGGMSVRAGGTRALPTAATNPRATATSHGVIVPM